MPCSVTCISPATGSGGDEVGRLVAERLGIEVLQVDFSESHRFAIAGLHCATLELVRDQEDD